jgi:hypothetical protein
VFSANIALPDVACKSLQTLQRFAFVGGFYIGFILLISKSLQTLQRFAVSVLWVYLCRKKVL